MKKAKTLLLTAAVIAAALTGCAGQGGSAFSPSASCVYIAQDGSVSSALVKEYEGETIDQKDLKQYLEAAVIRYNKENGGSETAENKSGAGEKLPAALQSLTVKDGVMKAVFEYASIEDLAKFRQTNDNADDSNTVMAVEVKKAGDAASAGWFADGAFVKADGTKVSAEELSKDAESTAALIEGGGTVMFAGKILYMPEGVKLKDEYTAAIPEDGKSVVVFK